MEISLLIFYEKRQPLKSWGRQAAKMRPPLRVNLRAGKQKINLVGPMENQLKTF